MNTQWRIYGTYITVIHFYNPVLPYLIPQYLCLHPILEHTQQIPFLLCVEGTCDLLGNSKERSGVLYFHIYVLCNIWYDKILWGKRLKKFRQMNVFLISFFMQFNLVMSFIIFESWHFKNFLYDMQSPLECNFFWIRLTILNMYLQFPVFHSRSGCSIGTNKFTTFFLYGIYVPAQWLFMNIVRTWYFPFSFKP